MKWLFLLALVSLTSCGSRHKQEKHEADPDSMYVCSSARAKRYHSVSDCKGLQRCSGEILEMTIEEAEDEDKSPCRMCVK